MKIKNNEFLKSVMVLTSGTVIAQIISYLITPLLTRIYSTEEMGDLGVYMRAAGFISALATARYELSLPLPKNDSHSFILYRLSLRIAGYILLACGAIGVIYLFFRPFTWYEVLFVLITLVSSLFMVLINLGTNWSIRMKQFNKISFSKVSNSFSSNLLRWLFGYLGWGSLGLLIATLIGFFLSSLSFVKELFQLSKSHGNVSKKKMYVLSKEYRQFPIVSLPHALIDLGRDLLVATLIIAFFSKDIFGSFNHSYTILRLPLMVIGASIGQVFFNRCSTMINEGKEIYPLLKKTMLMLFGLSIIPFGMIFFLGEPLFAFVFGSNWAESGYFSEIMAVWLMFNFINSPVSSIPMILNRQKEFFIMGLVNTFIQIFAFGALPLIIGNSKDSFILILWILSLSQAFYMIIVSLFTLYYSRKGVKR
ncbi:MAG: lipopolysaccharide biosynthesis protein [Bacteroidetes bacterium]|nr:MAG: lipopolysaccharide biosynthesis protein [Bacteroidota bacterium]